MPAASHLALVIGPDGCRARRLGIAHEIPVWEIGACARALAYPGLPEISTLAHDRQVRAFGPRGQAIISHIAVAIIGLGGTGSAVAQQLAHLGVRRFILIDPDVVEMTKLNRLVGATPADIGRPKAEVAARHIRSINSKAEITALRADIVDEASLPALYGADFLFLCTDSHASRAVVGQLAYQFLLPCIDMGVSITVRENAITHGTGRTQMLAPGLPVSCAHRRSTANKSGARCSRRSSAPPIRMCRASTSPPFGKRFAPRLRNLKDRKFHTFEKGDAYPALSNHIGAPICVFQ
ncbi:MULTISPECIES: ThiF family adenylyltransferase [unclassified Mesorhizobium]|uniref:ThiF family adenylyltransferase n=1 Tax=unclassified Mesorhizobium TaxID=325217 RepID=UPI001675D252|nr:MULTISPECIES: ThiF family adenylyltransferase [unclassified Mesorhizobium]